MTDIGSPYPHPDEVLNALLAKGHRRDKEAKLRKLHELCAIEYSRRSPGARDLSVANMSKVAEKHGLFKARAIYNEQSRDYATVIKAWGAHNGPQRAKDAKAPSEPKAKYLFLERIEDPAIRSLCRMALIERDKMRAELNLLKSKTEVVVDMRPLGTEATWGSRDLAAIEPAEQLTDSERKALSAAIDPDVLAKRKLRIGDTGEVIDERGRFVFAPGFATAIAKVLGRAAHRTN